MLRKSTSIRRLLLFQRTYISVCNHSTTTDNLEPYKELLEQVEKHRQELRLHLKSSFKHRHLSKSIANIKETITDMEAKRMKLNASSAEPAVLPPTCVSLEILSNGTTHLSPCALIKTATRNYLFNCPEGTTRFMSALRVKTNNTYDFFMTRGTWDNIGGLAGAFLGKESTTIPTRLHGPRSIKQYLECIRPFMDADFGSVKYPIAIEELTYENKFYEDVAITVQYIPMFGNSSKNNRVVDVAYLIKLKEPCRSIDPFKLIRLKIPKGPLIGQLKVGNTVELPDGRTIRPEDVYTDSNSGCEKPNLLVAEVETDEKLDCIRNSQLLQSFTTGGKDQINFLLHFTKDEILKTQKYRDWMQAFGPECRHIILNGTGPVVPQMENIYAHQLLLNKIDSDLFPELYPFGFRGVVTQEDDNTVEPETLSIPPVLKRFQMRGSSVGEEPISYEISDVDWTILYPYATEIPKLVADYQQKFPVSNSENRDVYPIVNFLGTSSATPSRYRNVSGYLVQFNDHANVLIDCGEGTYGQIRVLFGPEECEKVLLNLGAIFVTHSHQDHMNGLFLVIGKRIEAFRKLGVPYKSLILVCNRNVRKPITQFSKTFDDVESYISIVDITMFLNTFSYDSSENGTVIVENATKYQNPIQQKRVVIDLGMHFPKELYTPDDWNLRSVKAVQVHHTRMANGFVFVDERKRRKLVFSGDTTPCDILIEHGMDADLLVHEATFGDGMEEDAFRKRHSTIGQAVDVGRRMRAKHVILTHFSARYSRVCPLPEYLFGGDDGGGGGDVGRGEAVTPNVGVAMDNMRVCFDRLDALPNLLPVYRQIFSEELFDINLKKNQRSLRSREKVASVTEKES